MKELNYIQANLKAPKDQWNDFGKYKYRNAENILEAVKPLLSEKECTLTISDEIVQVGDRIYVKATATIKNKDNETESATAFAREPLTKKGIDESQVTGAASSYARKYALNGLLCIDDTKDADALNNSPAYTQKQSGPSDEELKEAFDMIKANIENAPSKQYLQDLHVQNVALHNYAPYKNAMNKRFKEVK